jgi:isopenicillin N synthase-like dioxygenase
MSASIARAAGGRPELVADTIPLLDVAPYLAGAPGALDRLGAELRWAFENVGFYYLRGHGIPPSLIDATFAQAARFHALPMEEKLAVAVNADNVGYLPMMVGQFPRCEPSRNAAFFLRRDRTAEDPPVRAGAASRLNQGRGPPGRETGAPTCRRWRDCAGAWCRSMPLLDRRMPSTGPMRSRT